MGAIQFMREHLCTLCVSCAGHGEARADQPERVPNLPLRTEGPWSAYGEASSSLGLVETEDLTGRDLKGERSGTGNRRVKGVLSGGNSKCRDPKMRVPGYKKALEQR